MPEDSVLGDGRETEDRTPSTGPTADDRPVEAPAEDAAEQQAEVWPADGDQPAEAREPSDDADPADRADQERVVSYDDDEYR
jgi:hypothetical protein